MSELKEVFISKTTGEIAKSLAQNSFLHTPAGYTAAEFANLRNSLLADLHKITGVKPKTKIIMTGHQPDFLHPGILFKDILTSKIAADINATAMHLIVDTDQVGMDFITPVKNGNLVHLEHFQFHKREHNIYRYVKTNSDDLQKLQSIRERIDSLQSVLPAARMQMAHALLDDMTIEAEKTEFIYQVAEKFRNKFTDNNLHLTDLHLSDLIRTECFQVFVEKIRERHSSFRNIFNNHLHNYRTEHKIKNGAQPVPDLKDNEMPFWIVDSQGNRQHMFTDSPNQDIIPRAVTLTMFLRIFLADFFIHGTGGGRYEIIADKTLHDFFAITPGDYIVATATMNLNPETFGALDFPDKKTIHKMERDWEFSPQRLLARENPLAMEKRLLIGDLASAAKGEKKRIHDKIMALNLKMQTELAPFKQTLDSHKKNLSLYNQTREVFSARNLPFIFYNIQELQDFVKKMNFFPTN